MSLVGGPGWVVVTFADGRQEPFQDATWQTEPGWLWVTLWDRSEEFSYIVRTWAWPAHEVKAVSSPGPKKSER